MHTFHVRLAALLLALSSTTLLRAAPADQPVPPTNPMTLAQHPLLVERAHRGHIDVYFLGDSITRRWAGPDYPQFLADWKKTFRGWDVADFGCGGDTTQNILWRLDHGEMDGANPKVIVLLAGTNNVGKAPRPGVADDVPRGIKAILARCQAKALEATIVLMAIFPRNDGEAANPVINEINAKLATFADGKRIRFLNINDQLADANGRLHEGMTVDQLHPTLKGYAIWAKALKPVLTELIGPPHTDTEPEAGPLPTP